MSSEIIYDHHDDGTATLRVNRPHARNALNWAAQEQFAAAVQQATAEPPRALIITGTGRAFVAGGDVRQLADHPEPEAGDRLNRVMSAALAQLTLLPCPVIGAVNGSAAGGGTEILTACDLRLTVPHAHFHFVQIRMGLTTGWGGGPRLVRLLGHGRAAELLLTGQSITADHAARIGFVQRVLAADEDAHDAARAWARDLIQLPAEALAAMKRLLHDAAERSLADGYRREAELFRPLYGRPDNREAIAAFAEKRPPVFNQHLDHTSVAAEADNGR